MMSAILDKAWITDRDKVRIADASIGARKPIGEQPWQIAHMRYSKQHPLLVREFKRHRFRPEISTSIEKLGHVGQLVAFRIIRTIGTR
jgi:hypothetical protein